MTVLRMPSRQRRFFAGSYRISALATHCWRALRGISTPQLILFCWFVFAVTQTEGIFHQTKKTSHQLPPTAISGNSQRIQANPLAAVPPTASFA
jgi:hypothetical protein